VFHALIRGCMTSTMLGMMVARRVGRLRLLWNAEAFRVGRLWLLWNSGAFLVRIRM